jgi:hypothetical protein
LSEVPHAILFEFVQEVDSIFFHALISSLNDFSTELR